VQEPKVWVLVVLCLAGLAALVFVALRARRARGMSDELWRNVFLSAEAPRVPGASGRR
jgi:hypothetical protein